MAAQHGDGCTAGDDGYASNRTAGSDDSEDCGCCVGGPTAMSHEDVKLEAWQAAVSPKLDCCTEPTLKASTLQ